MRLAEEKGGESLHNVLLNERVHIRGNTYVGAAVTWSK
jgi:hypothetical protein